MAGTAERMEAILRKQFEPVHLEIVDESAEHVGHPGAASGGGHYRVTLVSARFENLPPLARHRLVNASLADLLAGEIHALALTTIAPSEGRG
jgi:BolA protein